ncbi:MAG: membrane protein insertase YidC, partial [Spirochaetaceae bacterium]|nr:membrane protein insertase YidC [Spirochaetaceae bacterium]
MEKKTILAIVLSVAVIVVYYSVMAVFFPPKNQPEETARQPAAASERISQSELAPESSGLAADTSSIGEPFKEEEVPLEYVNISTKYLDVTLSNEGGDIVSYKLKEHLDGDEYVDMILSGGGEPHAFSVAFGGIDAKPLDARFSVSRLSDTIVEFSRAFSAQNSAFILKKKYTFVPEEYMFELDITLDGGSRVPPLNFAGAHGTAAYTLEFGPQIGSKFKTLDEREDYRHYITYTDGKLKNEKVSAAQDAVIVNNPLWLGITGKYFALLAVPDNTRYSYVFSARGAESGLSAVSRMYIERPPLSSSVQTDVFRFYLGPKNSSTLEIYETNRSHWTDLAPLSLSKAASTSGFWAILNPLEWALKKLLTFFFRLFPNYGVAIILVTLLVKLILFPLTKKSSEGTLRMQSIAPRIKELQEKYKDNPVKLNAEMGALYKKEGYNPLSGCLPLLIQIPIFFAMYNLFNNHFELRGAVFIPGWIPDLSQPEFVHSFAPSKLPLLGWSELRILPFVYVGSQLLYGKITQTPDQKSNAQMKMMLYIMPVVFFFVLYNVPSGL